MNCLVTGGTGFIGHHLVRRIFDKTNWNITILDRCSYVGCQSRLDDLLPSRRIRFIFHDLRFPIKDNKILCYDLNKPDIIFHLAASTHVDRSISEPLDFVQDNVVGTCNLLDWLRIKNKYAKFFYFSTDEVFGPAPDGSGGFKETDRYNSSNPYAATKAGAEELCVAFANTYKLHIIITHCMNVIGERQHPEKFIPLVIRKILTNETIYVHSNESRTQAGSRFYVHAKRVADAILFLTDKAASGEKYNIVGDREISNLEMVQKVAAIVKKKPHYELVDFHSSRPGHDLRYALDGSKLKNMGFKYENTFDEDLKATVLWYLTNKFWL